MPDQTQTTGPTEALVAELRCDWAWQRPCRDAARKLLARASEECARQERLCAAIEAKAKSWGLKL